MTRESRSSIIANKVWYIGTQRGGRGGRERLSRDHEVVSYLTDAAAGIFLCYYSSPWVWAQITNPSSFYLNLRRLNAITHALAVFKPKGIATISSPYSPYPTTKRVAFLPWNPDFKYHPLIPFRALRRREFVPSVYLLDRSQHFSAAFLS